MLDYYHILGLDRGAGRQQIRDAYKRLAFQFHPDRNPDNPEAEEKFKLIAQAYEVLSDDVKKINYDLGIYRETPYPSEILRAILRRYAEAGEPIPERDSGLSENARRWTVALSVVFFTGFVIFAIYFQGFMNTYTARNYLTEAKNYHQQGNHAYAVLMLRKAFEFDYKLPEAYFFSAELDLELEQDYESAIENLTKGISFSRQAPKEVFFTRGYCYYQIYQYKEALEDFNTCLKLDSKQGNVYFYMAIVYLALKEENSIQKACAALTQAGRFGVKDAFSYKELYCR
ncbi:MAG TPA: hypothetical protein DCM08_05615 [Microscillaceae bacterium]|nr:hypothetical protein [Microscillaceae bacterium]